MSLKTLFSSKIATFFLVAVLFAITQLAISQEDASKTAEPKAAPTNSAPILAPENTAGDQATDPKPTAGVADAEEKVDSPAVVNVETVGLQEEWFDNANWFKNTDDKSSSVFDPIDQSFGSIVVAPVASVFFFDVYYFDNAKEKTFKTVADLKKAISNAQAELKSVRLELGLDVPKKKVEASGDESAEKKEEKEPKSPTTLRDGLKTKIRDAFNAILASKKNPSDDMKSTMIAIKQAFFALDFAIRQTEGKQATKAQLIVAVEAITDPVAALSKQSSLSKTDFAWALADIGGSARDDYYRDIGREAVDKMVNQQASDPAFTSMLESLVNDKLLAEENGVYSVATKEVDGKTVDASFAAIGIPFIVMWLVLGAIFFTFRMAFINLRGFTHAIAVTKGDYDDPSDQGEISHFQALSSALSATVGLGNIGGVAVAVSLGGPGAVVWMILAGFLGMTSKFTECTLGQMYRKVDENGQVLGGPMRYLSSGLAEMNLGLLGKILAFLFVILCIGGSFGGGNMYQSNQSYSAVKEAIPFFADKAWLYGLIMAFMVGLVILGGIKRIGTAAALIVPFMCLIYVLGGLFIIIYNASLIPTAFGTMFFDAFSFKAGFGGFMGILIVGFQRSAFSNEAGTGSASIAHSAAATDEPVREGIVALLEPFIDTIIVCTMTGLVVVISGAYLDKSLEGVEITQKAFGTVVWWFPYILTFAVVMFAFSTMISWSYYGERCATWLFGASASVPYKFVFLVFVFLGAVLKLNNVLDFSDLMILGMAFPNILGMLFLSGKVKRGLDSYWKKLDNGEFDGNKNKA
ncbi:alanine:cation symporter family protein [Pirellulaceae bacterium]|nr:alanine:cation symporter family protein [Pirellulaceae bacterium]